MASTYTPKLNLAKPAHGDVNWHIPINENWDKLDTKVDNAAKTALVSKITVDADKNWNGKNITNVGTLSANSLILSEPEFIIAPVRTTNAEYLLKSSDAAVSGEPTEAWVLLKSLPPLPTNVLSASVYVSYDLKSLSSAPVKARIYVNGGAVGTVRTSSGYSYTTFGEVISGLKTGDVIQIYSQGNIATENTPTVRNLRVYGVTIQSIPRPLGSW